MAKKDLKCEFLMICANRWRMLWLTNAERSRSARFEARRSTKTDDARRDSSH